MVAQREKTVKGLCSGGPFARKMVFRYGQITAGQIKLLLFALKSVLTVLEF